MRLRSDLWVSALVRRAFAAGAGGAVVRSGDEAAGAIFVSVDRLDGTADLHGPAAQAESGDATGDRRFETLLRAVPHADVSARLERERRFDSDLWWVEVSDRDGRCFIEPPPHDPTAVRPPMPAWPPRIDDV